MKPAHHDGQSGLAERPGNIERARILVRLHPNQGYEPEIAVALELFQQPGNVDAGVGLVDCDDVDGDAGSKHLARRAVAGDAVDSGQRVRRDHRSPPANDIAVIVVVGGLDENELKPPVLSAALIGHDTAFTPEAFQKYLTWVARNKTTCHVRHREASAAAGRKKTRENLPFRPLAIALLHRTG